MDCIRIVLGFYYDFSKILLRFCEQKAADIKSCKPLSNEEIVNLEKAIEIIDRGVVSGNAYEHLPTVLLLKTTLTQLRADSSSQNQLRVAANLQKRAEALGSRVLSALAEHVEVDPFDKVKKMIEDFIVKLMKVIEFDFARFEASTKVSETATQKE